MAIVTQTDKRSGITYAYDTEYYWDKSKKQSRSKRICVGKVDPVTKVESSELASFLTSRLIYMRLSE